MVRHGWVGRPVFPVLLCEKVESVAMVYPWESDNAPPPPVLVLGMHNSGTTMVARILHHSGLFLANNSGRCESHLFSLYINDQLVMGGGDAWARLPVMTVDEVLACRGFVEPIVKNYWRFDYVQWGYDGSGPWGIKDPRLCILLPLYLEMFPGAKLLLIRRNLDDIAASLSHRWKPGVGIKDDRDYWRALAEAHVERVEQYSTGNPCFEVEYERLCREPLAAAAPMFEFLELSFDDEARRRVRSTVRTDRIGTRNWSNARWRYEKAKRWFHIRLGSLYAALTCRR